MQARSASHHLPRLDLVHPLPHQGSFLPGPFSPQTRVSPIPRVPGRHLPGSRRERGYSIGEENIQSHEDSHNTTNRTDHPAHILPNLRHHYTGRVTHSFLLPYRAANTARRSYPSTLNFPPSNCPLQTRRTIAIFSHRQTATNLSNQPTIINTQLTTSSLILFPTLRFTTSTTTT